MAIELGSVLHICYILGQKWPYFAQSSHEPRHKRQTKEHEWHKLQIHQRAFGRPLVLEVSSVSRLCFFIWRKLLIFF